MDSVILIQPKTAPEVTKELAVSRALSYLQENGWLVKPDPEVRLRPFPAGLYEGAPAEEYFITFQLDGPPPMLEAGDEDTS